MLLIFNTLQVLVKALYIYSTFGIKRKYIFLTYLLQSPPLFDHAVCADCCGYHIQIDSPPYSFQAHTRTLFRLRCPAPRSCRWL